MSLVKYLILLTFFKLYKSNVNLRACNEKTDSRHTSDFFLEPSKLGVRCTLYDCKNH